MLDTSIKNETKTFTLEKGTRVKLVVNPDAHYRFIKWDDEHTSSTRIVTITLDISLEALLKLFAIVSVKVNDDNYATCSGSGDYDISTTITITTKSNDLNEYEFVKWEGIEESEQEFELEVVEDTSITAIYKEMYGDFKPVTQYAQLGLEDAQYVLVYYNDTTSKTYVSNSLKYSEEGKDNYLQANDNASIFDNILHVDYVNRKPFYMKKSDLRNNGMQIFYKDKDTLEKSYLNIDTLASLVDDTGKHRFLNLANINDASKYDFEWLIYNYDLFPTSQYQVSEDGYYYVNTLMANCIHEKIGEDEFDNDSIYALGIETGNINYIMSTVNKVNSTTTVVTKQASEAIIDAEIARCGENLLVEYIMFEKQEGSNHYYIKRLNDIICKNKSIISQKEGIVDALYYIGSDVKEVPGELIYANVINNDQLDNLIENDPETKFLIRDASAHSNYMGDAYTDAKGNAYMNRKTSIKDGLYINIKKLSNGYALYDYTSGQYIASTAVKKTGLVDSEFAWTITINSNGTTIYSGSTTVGNLVYNYSSPRFTTYISAQCPIEILYATSEINTKPSYKESKNFGVDVKDNESYLWDISFEDYKICNIKNVSTGFTIFFDTDEIEFDTSDNPSSNISLYKFIEFLEIEDTEDRSNKWVIENLNFFNNADKGKYLSFNTDIPRFNAYKKDTQAEHKQCVLLFYREKK